MDHEKHNIEVIIRKFNKDLKKEFSHEDVDS